MNFEDKFEARTPFVVPGKEWLQSTLGNFLGTHEITEVELLNGGYSNGNLKLKISGWDDAFVMRISNRARGSVEAEAAVLNRVSPAAPVPEVVHAAWNVPGHGPDLKQVLLFRYLPGVSLHLREDSWPKSHVEAVATQLGEILARVHSLQFSTSGIFTGSELAWEIRFEDFSKSMIHHMRENLVTARKLQRLDSAETERVERYLERHEKLVSLLGASRSLVHSDFNQKNILVDDSQGSPQVTGILDWEFAFAGSPIMDFGNFFRHEEELPKGYQPQLLNAYHSAGGSLPDDWRETARYLDLMNHLMFLAQPVERPKTFAMARKVLFATIGAN